MGKQIVSGILALFLYLGLHNGYIALWDSECTTPKMVYPYHISLYPKIDRTALENGIVISSTGELTKLLDDFLS